MERLDCDLCDYSHPYRRVPLRHRLFLHIVRKHSQSLPWAAQLKARLRADYKMTYAKIVSERAVCDRCDARLASVKSLQEHWTLFHRNRTKQARRFGCDECGKILMSSSQVGRHLKLHLALKRSEPPHKEQYERYGNSKVFCDACGSSIRRFRIARHMAGCRLSSAALVRAVAKAVWRPTRVRVTCDLCSGSLTSKWSFSNHRCHREPPWLRTKKPRRITAKSQPPRSKVTVNKMRSPRITQPRLAPERCRIERPVQPRKKLFPRADWAKQRSEKLICDACDEQVNNRSELMNEHSCTRMLFTCPDCPGSEKLFRSKSIRAHQRQVHEAEAAVCDRCEKTMAQKSVLHWHSCQPPEPLEPCPVRGRLYLAAHLAAHLERRHGEGQAAACDDCGRVYPRRSRLAASHNCHRERAECPECGQLVSRPYLKTHLARHVQAPADSEEAVCDGCGHVFFSCYTIGSSHRCRALAGPRPDVDCADCGLTFTPGGYPTHRLHKHDYPLGRALHCDVCGASEESRDNFSTHIRQHLREALPPPPPAPPLVLGCDFCAFAASSRESLFRHLCRFHDREPGQGRLFTVVEERYIYKAPGDGGSDLKVRCDRCCSLVRYSALQQHLAEECHGPEVGERAEKVGCAECGVVYVSRQSLLEHVVFGHPEGRRLYGLVARFAKFTTGEKANEKVVCDQCGQTRNRSQLRHHFETHRS